MQKVRVILSTHLTWGIFARFGKKMALYSQLILSRTLPFIGQHDNCELFRRQITPKDLTEFLAWAPFTLAYGAVPQAGPQKFGFCWKKGFIRGIWGHSWGFEKLVIPQFMRVSDKSIIPSKRPEISMNRDISIKLVSYGLNQDSMIAFLFPHFTLNRFVL